MRIFSIVLLSLTGACQWIRTMPEPVSLDFSLEALIEATTPDIEQRNGTKIVINLTPNNEATQASSLSLTKWQLPEGVIGSLCDDKGNIITADTPLAWGRHVWWYRPVSAGTHIITLCLSEAYEETPRIIVLDPIQVPEPEEEIPVSFYVSAWLRALTGGEVRKPGNKDQDMVALEIRLEDITHATADAGFRLQRWELPEGVKCVVQNAAQEPLHTFPIKAGASNTLFLSFDQGNNYCDTHLLRLQVQGPGGVIGHQEVPLTLVHGKALERRMGELSKLGLRTGDKNPADYLRYEDATQLYTGERLAKQYIGDIKRVMDQAAGFSDHLPGEMAEHYQALKARKEVLEGLESRLDKKERIWSTIERHGSLAATVKYFARFGVDDENEEACFRVALRKHGVNKRIEWGKNKRPALLWVVEKDHRTALRILLEEGADVNVGDLHGETALMIAAAKGNFWLTRHLIEKGADLLARMNRERKCPCSPGRVFTCVEGWSVLYAAIEGRSVAIIELLEHTIDNTPQRGFMLMREVALALKAYPGALQPLAGPIRSQV